MSGLLSVAISAYNYQSIDAYLVPVGISYDRILEGDFHDELLGRPKKRESVWRVIWTLARLLMFDYGRQHCGDVLLNFGEPVRLSVSFALCFV